METITTPHSRQTVNFCKNFFENTFWEQQKLVVGIDEVGRGCLSGPLVTAAAILPVGCSSRLLKDSKLLSPDERLIAYRWIIRHCHYQIGIVHHRIIDKHNIRQATILAMKKALVNLLCLVKEQPGAILVDAMPLKLFDTGFPTIPVYHFPKGEQKSSSIAAASIVAKVTRDALMERYDNLFPGYQMHQHKGYATKIHQNQIHKMGYSIIHRESFLGAFQTPLRDDDSTHQQPLF